jgi:hypothetical protein
VQILHGIRVNSKGVCSERFGAVLPCVLNLLETEWRESRQLMTSEERALLRQAHQALGRLNELGDGAP